MSLPPLTNTLRAARQARGWSQALVADRTGLSRAAVSAIEVGRAAPSAAAALALARLFETTVEALFRLGDDRGGMEGAWAWAPEGETRAKWNAEVAGRRFDFPVESTGAGLLAPDEPLGVGTSSPERTIVLAGCDPAVGILAGYLAAEGYRLLPFTRSSGQALNLLAAGRVHAAGIHLDDNRKSARAALGDGYQLLHLARWDQGLGLARGLDVSTVESALAADLRWVGREAGSGARHCLDRILEGHAKPRGYEHIARDHGSVAQTIATGWAQAGVCVRLTAEQAHLHFLSIQQEAYEFAVSRDFLEEPRGQALLRCLRSKAFRAQLASAAGYDTQATGELILINDA